MHPKADAFVISCGDGALLSCLSCLDSAVHMFQTPVHFLSDVHLERPGCVIAEMTMPGIDGFELLQRVRESKSPLSLIMVTDSPDVATAIRVMEYGAVTLLAKSCDCESLLRAVKRGQAISEERWKELQVLRSVEERLAQLTDEERLVMQAVLSGKPSRCIASELNMSLRTVDRRRRAVLTKLHVASVPELAAVVGRQSARTGT